MDDARLKKVTGICLALPDATVERHGEHAGFRVRKKVFMYFVSNHHGDGIIGIYCKVLPGDNTALIAAAPARFFMPAYVGHRGWVGLRLDVGKVDWAEVAELIRGSYELTRQSPVAGKSDKVKKTGKRQ